MPARLKINIVKVAVWVVAITTLGGCETPGQTALLGALLSGNAAVQEDPQRAQALAAMGSSATSYANAQAGRAQVSMYSGTPEVVSTGVIPNVVRAPNGQLSPAPGYQWLTSSIGDYRTVWTPNLAHPDIPHIISGQRERSWNPAPGYTWVTIENNDMRVKWVPGLEHPHFPNIIAAPTEQQWTPANGYHWRGSSPNGAMAVDPN